MYMQNVETLDTNYGAPLCSSKLTTKNKQTNKNLKVALGKCVQMYIGHVFAWGPQFTNAPWTLCQSSFTVYGKLCVNNVSFNSTWLLKKKKKIPFFKIFILLFIFLSFPC